MGESVGDKHFFAKRFIRNYCPNVSVDDLDWATASDPTDTYNCFGFAVGRLLWWEPIGNDPDEQAFVSDHYWPDGVSGDGTVDSYVSAAEGEGFRVSTDGAFEQGFETIVLYFIVRTRKWTHAARQSSPGVWASKLGTLSDIEHPFDGVDNVRYGTGRVYLKRPWPPA